MRLSIKKAAERVGVSQALMYQWCQERRITHYRLGGKGRRGKIVIDETDLDAFLEKCRVEEGADDEGELHHIR